MSIREAFFDTATTARDLIAHDRVVASWDAPSALREMTVGALAGHLARGVFTVSGYLDAPEPEHNATPLSADAYFVEGARLTNDIYDELNTSIRERSVAEAADGHEALVDRLTAAIAALREAFPAVPSDRCIAVFGGNIMTIDEYLVARLLELMVHLDDLAVSLGVPTPPTSSTARDAAIGCLLGMARRNHGDLAVIRAMARRERGSADVLRVL